MNTNLHNADYGSTTVRNYENFVSVTIKDNKGNDVTLFFSNRLDVLNFAFSIEEQLAKLGTLYTRENLKA